MSTFWIRSLIECQNRFSDEMGFLKSLAHDAVFGTTDLPTFLAFIEQMKRIAGKLSATIQGIGLRLLRSFLPCFTPSIRRHPRRRLRHSWAVLEGTSAAYYSSRASCTAINLTVAQAWDRFLKVYKDTIKYLPKMNLDPDAPEAPGNTSTPNCANPATDFRVLGINVFKELICAKYQPQMWGF